MGNVGFTVKIPEIIKLAEEHEKLQLALRAGDEKEIIWEATAAEVKDFCEESLIEYHIDEEQITQESILTVRGWVVNQLEPDEIFVQGTDGKVLECTITRQRRPDVEEAKGISEEEKRNLGFSITVNLENTNDQNICICFRDQSLSLFAFCSLMASVTASISACMAASCRSLDRPISSKLECAIMIAS